MKSKAEGFSEVRFSVGAVCLRRAGVSPGTGGPASELRFAEDLSASLFPSCQTWIPLLPFSDEETGTDAQGP